MSEVDHEKQRAVLSVWAGGETPMARACSYFLANDADLRRELSEVKELARRVIAVLRGKGYHDNGSLIAGGEAEKAMMELSEARGALGVAKAEAFEEAAETVNGMDNDHNWVHFAFKDRADFHRRAAALRPKPEPAKAKEEFTQSPCEVCHKGPFRDVAEFFNHRCGPPPSPESGKGCHEGLVGCDLPAGHKHIIGGPSEAK